MKKKWYVVLGSTILSIGLLAGCASEGEGLVPVDSTQDPVEAPASTEPAESTGTESGASEMETTVPDAAEDEASTENMSE